MPDGMRWRCRRTPAGRVHDRVAFVVGGRLVSEVARIEGPISTGLELPATDKDEATALVNRMRH